MRLVALTAVALAATHGVLGAPLLGFGGNKGHGGRERHPYPAPGHGVSHVGYPMGPGPHGHGHGHGYGAPAAPRKKGHGKLIAGLAVGGIGGAVLAHQAHKFFNEPAQGPAMGGYAENVQASSSYGGQGQPEAADADPAQE